MTAVNVAERTIEVTNADKVMFPDAGITKEHVVRYHHRIGTHMLPFLEERPLVMRRFPDGIAESGFYQKEIPDHFPEWIDVVTLDKHEGGTVTHVVANDPATLVYLANQGVLEIHTLLSPASSPDRPDQLMLRVRRDPEPRPRPRRRRGRAGVGAADHGAVEEGPWRAGLRRLAPQQLRTARRGSLRSAGATRNSRRRPARLGRSDDELVRSPAVHDRERLPPVGTQARPLERHRPTSVLGSFASRSHRTLTADRQRVHGSLRAGRPRGVGCRRRSTR